LEGRGKCLVLRLLYSYLARGTAIKKSAWCYAIDDSDRPRQGCPGRSRSISRDWGKHPNGLLGIH
jgi:hypothetical protein